MKYVFVSDSLSKFNTFLDISHKPDAAVGNADKQQADDKYRGSP